MNNDPVTKARLQAVIIEGRKRVAERRRRIEELARASSQGDAGDRDASTPDDNDRPVEEHQNEFYDADFEARMAGIAAWLDDEPEYRIVTIDELMKIGAPESGEAGENDS